MSFFVGRSALLKPLIIGVLVVIGLFVVPSQVEDKQLNELVDILIPAIAALGLALLTGFSGQVSLGHGAFMGTGAYVTAIFVAEHGWPFVTATALGVVVAFVLGCLIGLPALKITGPALALATLGVAVLFPQVLKRFASVTGGSGGRDGGDFYAPSWSPPWLPDWTDEQYLFTVVFAVFVLVALLLRNLIRSRVGRALIAIRDNEVAAESLGVHVAAYKVTVFGLSGSIGALAGSLQVMRTGRVNAGSFDLLLSIELLVIAVIGGIATILGPLVGSAAYFYSNDFIKERLGDFLPDTLADPEMAPVLFGVALIALMLVMPDGIVGGTTRIGRRIWTRIAPGPESPASRPDSG